MALSKERKLELAARAARGELPEERDAREMLERFLTLSGYTSGEIASAIGYSAVAIANFRTCRYNDNVPGVESNTAALRVRLKEFIEPKLEAYNAAGVAGSCAIYRTGNYQLIRKAFFNALDRGWAYCLDGAPGTRKTFPLRSLVAEVVESEANKRGSRKAIYVRCRIGIRPQALLQKACCALGLPARGTIDQLLRKIQFHLMGHRAVLVLDEAQLLGIDCLETVRELLDMPPYIGLIFAGSHDLQERFKALQMEQFRSRLQKTIELRAGVTESEALDMIVGELGEGYARSELRGVIRTFRVQDPRRGHARSCRCDECSYISARSLFNWTEQVRLGLAGELAKGGAA